MNKRKIFILLVVLFAVLGISLSAVSASTTTIKLPKSAPANLKYVGSGDHKDIIESMFYDKKIEVHIISVFSGKSQYYKITKAKVFFKNKKGKKISKIYKIKNKRKLVKKVPKGYTPYKVVVTYSKKKK